MNIENMKKLRNHLQAVKDGTDGPVGFNMRVWTPTKAVIDGFGGLERVYADHSGHDCGTVCCIAGHVALLEGYNTGPNAPRLYDLEVEHFARDYLGLDEWSSNRLFAPGFAYNIRNITLGDALRVIDHAIETGTVDWQEALGSSRYEELGG